MIYRKKTYLKLNTCDICRIFVCQMSGNEKEKEYQEAGDIKIQGF